MPLPVGQTKPLQFSPTLFTWIFETLSIRRMSGCCNLIISRFICISPPTLISKMEIAGLAIGLAGLYSACIDTAQRFESYKNFQAETRQLSAQFQADKAVLQRWADKIGITHRGLSDSYDRRLDKPEIAQAVRDILLCLRTLLEGAQGKTRYDSAMESVQTRPFVRIQDSTSIQSVAISSRKRDKFSWTFGGKEKFVAFVDTFSALVAKLDSLVPIDTSIEQPFPSEGLQQLSSEGKLNRAISQTTR